MEECCVVCAEPLEWVGYGVCGHRDVCSTCIARLRFVLNDKRCCICKQECTCVFMTKALGDYTKIIKDFEGLHKCGNFWFECNTQAFFDDKDHYTMVKAMCRLSCQICDQAEDYEFSKDFVKKGHVFKSLDLLQRHILIAHKVQMCSLCLEGRKIFICEQKLYSKAQLECHSAKGDSEIDGGGEESGGFSGHPLCSFCQIRYYSDNELYHHMSVDHYLCHICKRLHPGQFEYFHNYDNLEAHFRHEHFLCEHPDCLAKKFVVFTSDVELKRHSALTHGGTMSRSQRNAVLQIPVSFQYRRPPIRGHASSLNIRNHSNVRMPLGTHGCIPPISEAGEYSAPPGAQSTEINAAESSDRTGESSLISEHSRYRTAAGGTMLPCLEESAFPPLPGSKTARRKAKQRVRGPAASVDGALGGSDRRGSSISSRQSQMPGRTEDKPCSGSSTNQWLQAPGRGVRSEGVVNVVHTANAVKARNSGPVIEEKGGRLPATESPLLGGLDNGFQITNEVRIANKALGDCIRSRLGEDEKLFMAFKDLSADFRRGELGANLYCRYIAGLGLWDLVPELARLCPEPERQRSLLDAYEEGPNKKEPIASRESPLIPHCSDGHGRDIRRAEISEHASVLSTVDAMAALRLTDRGGTRAENKIAVAHHKELKGKQRADSSACSSAGSSSANNSHNNPENLLVNDGACVDFPSRLNKTWICNVCTLENNELSSECAACEASRPNAADPSASNSCSSAGNISANNAHNKPENLLVNGRACVDFPSSVNNTWICSVCTLENNEVNSECAACESSRPNAAASECHGKRTKKIGKFERLRLSDHAPLPSSPLQAREPAQKKGGAGAWKSGGGQRLVALAQRDAVIESAWKRSS